MKIHRICMIAASALLLLQFRLAAQSDRIGYAVTDSIVAGSKWSLLQSIDLRTGTYTGVITPLLTGIETGQGNGNLPLVNGVAAIAHDAENKRVYFTPMLTDKLAYVDLRTRRIHTVTNSFTGLMPKNADQGNIITRMVIANGRYGYALTNDGKHLVRFSRNNNAQIADLGSLIDAPSNTLVSVFMACGSYGGDLIADEDGHLYLVTVGNHVFKIKISTRVATYIGTISGLPPSFATSGVSVSPRENKLIIVSHTDNSAMYKVRMNTLDAVAIQQSAPWRSADLASDNLLETEREHNQSKGDESNFLETGYNQNDSIRIYPNPVTAREFRIQLTNVAAGNYTATLINTAGQQIHSQYFSLSGKSAIVTFQLPSSITSDIYMIRLTDTGRKVVFTQKLVVE